MLDPQRERPLPPSGSVVPLNKHAKFDLLSAPISTDPLESLLRTHRRARNSQMNLRVDENEQRYVSVIRETYERRFGAVSSDQDVVRGLIRLGGKQLVDSGALDSAEEVAELRAMAVTLAIRHKANIVQQEYDRDLETIERIRLLVVGLVEQKLFKMAWKSVEDFLLWVEKKVREDGEAAAWAVKKIREDERFVKAVAELAAQGFAAELPELE